VGTNSHIKSNNAGSERNRPLYSFDKKKKRNEQRKSGNMKVSGSTRVDRTAELMAEIFVNEEFECKYAGTALAKKGATRTAPRTRGSSQ
jgi:hypothetical protein